MTASRSGQVTGVGTATGTRNGASQLEDAREQLEGAMLAAYVSTQHAGVSRPGGTAA